MDVVPGMVVTKPSAHAVPATVTLRPPINIEHPLLSAILGLDWWLPRPPTGQVVPSSKLMHTMSAFSMYFETFHERLKGSLIINFSL